MNIRIVSIIALLSIWGKGGKVFDAKSSNLERFFYFYFYLTAPRYECFMILIRISLVWFWLGLIWCGVCGWAGVCVGSCLCVFLLCVCVPVCLCACVRVWWMGGSVGFGGGGGVMAEVI